MTRNSMTRNIASLSMDLDNQWAYLRAAGRPGWAESACYFGTVIPRIVDLLNELDLPLTVFLVGRDLDADASVAAIERFSDLKAHEYCNHSYNHEPWLHTLSRGEIEHEIDRTSTLIEQRLGQPPLGFRGPGFSCPELVLSILAERKFLYDASLFPTSMAPLARAYYMLKTGLRGEDRQRASKLYGGWSAMRQPNRPFLRQVDEETADLVALASDDAPLHSPVGRAINKLGEFVAWAPGPWGSDVEILNQSRARGPCYKRGNTQLINRTSPGRVERQRGEGLGTGQLWEIPVTVMPLTRTPIHFSYLTYLASFSTLAAKTYFRTALRMCQLTGTAPSLLLHPPDFMGREDETEMGFFPAMQMPVDKKLAVVRWALKQFKNRFDVHTLVSQVTALRGNPDSQTATRPSAVQVVGTET